MVTLLAVGVAVQPAGASPRQDDADTTASTEPATTDGATSSDPTATSAPATDEDPAATEATTAASIAPSTDRPALLQQAVDKANSEVGKLTGELTAAEEADVKAREAAATRDQTLEADRAEEERLAEQAAKEAETARKESDQLAERLKGADDERVGANEDLMVTVGKLRSYSVAAYVANSSPPGLDAIDDDAAVRASRRRELLRSSGRAHVTRTKEAEVEAVDAETRVEDLAAARSAKVDEEQKHLEIESGHLGRAEALAEEREAAETAELNRRQNAASQRLALRKDLERANTVSKRFIGLTLDQTTTINGEPLLTGDDLARWFIADGRQANTTVPIEELADLFIEEGQAENIRADIAFAQSILETGSFSYPSGGLVKGTDNNFAGIGACDSCSNGFGFADARTGARAQMQLLKIYANPGLTAAQFANPTVRTDPEKLGVRGCCPTWKDLAGVWASNPNYFPHIQTVWNEIVTWVAQDYVLS
ncbi:MAG: glucosaminidase domain-containing protein [Microthrixaceae bacterium]|nr:glucosaminidase domain-containing protein [Microthrixaceae bacterium]